MIYRKKRLNTLLEAIKAYFEKLLMPENIGDVEADFLECFFLNKSRAKNFCATLARIVWEYNFVNKMFVQNYKKLASVSSKDPKQNIPASKDLMIFGGFYALSTAQIEALIRIVDGFPQIKSLSFNFTRIKNQGLQLLSKILKEKKWKTIRLNDPGLYSLDLTNNLVDQDGMQALVDLFFDQFDIRSAQINEAPLPTSIRILILDNNFLGKG